jgi:hypothetical protein
MKTSLIWIAVGHIAFVLTAALCGWIVRRGDKTAWTMPPSRVAPWAVAMLTALGIVFLCSPFLYLWSYASPAAHGKATEAFYDCASFSFPCLAGIVAGFGLVSERGKDYRGDRNAGFYLGSSVILAAAYIFYVARHPRPLVVFYSGVYIGITGLFALVTLLVQHFHAASKEAEVTQPDSGGLKIKPQWGTVAGVGEGLMALLLIVLTIEAVLVLGYTLVNADVAMMRLRPDE